MMMYVTAAYNYGPLPGDFSALGTSNNNSKNGWNCGIGLPDVT